MKSALLFLSVLFSFYICSCHKPPPGIYEHVYDAIKTDFNFKPGTYWIYRDTRSGRIDSFVVTSYIDTMLYVSSGGSYYPSRHDEHIYIDFIEYNVGPLPITDTTVNWRYDNTADGVGLTRNGSGFSVLFYYPAKDSFRIGYITGNYDTGLVTNVFADYRLNNGISFTHVVEVNHYDCNPPLVNYNDWYYASPGIGIIKMKFNHPLSSEFIVWELQRWNIVK